MTDMTENNHIKGIIEALLFVSERPIMLEQIKDVIGELETHEIRDIINALQKEYAERKSGMGIVEIAGGYQMLTSPNYAMYIKKFYRSTHKEKLSKPALETLAIVAYKQPVSRLDIELIRGVNCDGVVEHLLAKGLIKIAGRKDVPGRPYIYGTTKQFLEYFGLKTLADLPKLEDFSSLQPVGEADTNAPSAAQAPEEQRADTAPGQENNAGDAPQAAASSAEGSAQPS